MDHPSRPVTPTPSEPPPSPGASTVTEESPASSFPTTFNQRKSVLAPPFDYIHSDYYQWDGTAPSRLHLNTLCSKDLTTIPYWTTRFPSQPTLEDCARYLLWPVGTWGRTSRPVYAFLEHRSRKGVVTTPASIRPVVRRRTAVSYDEHRRPRIRLYVFPLPDGKSGPTAGVLEETCWSKIAWRADVVGEYFEALDGAYPDAKQWTLPGRTDVRSRYCALAKMLLYLRWIVDGGDVHSMNTVEGSRRAAVWEKEKDSIPGLGQM